MDNHRKREMKRTYLAQQRAEERAAFPLDVAELRAMFRGVAEALTVHGCDHSRRLAQAWLESRGHDAERVLEWLGEVGAGCDCEILLNVEDHVEEAMRDV